MHEVLKYDLKQDSIMLWHKDRDLMGLTTDDCIVLPGGFSYGDYLRTGAIARFSPIMETIIDFVNRGGKVLGVCNGFQILCESHLLPGALLRNTNQQYICKNVHIKDAEGIVYKIPIAHGEGRYYADEKNLVSLEKNNQVLFRYCDASGDISAKANCNGSIKNIAGICNEQRNVYGMMPHPERACSLALGNTDGKKVFKYLFSQVLETV